jgi:thioredoxin 1
MSNYATYGQLSSVPVEEMPDNLFSIKNMQQKQTLIQNHDLCVIDMYGEWCAPCKLIAPKFAELAKTYNRKNMCALVKEDVDLELPVVGNIDIQGVPTFLFYVNGQLRPELTVTGADINQVEAKIKRVLRL